MADDFYQTISRRATLIKAQIDYLENLIRNSPPGRIRVSKQRGKNRYYVCVDDDNGTYTSNQMVISALINKEYATKILPALQKELAALTALTENPLDAKLNTIYGKFHKEKQPLINQDIQKAATKKQIDSWLAQPYVKKEFSLYPPFHYSLSGVQVRSKSEGDIVDCLEARNIPFIYELPVRIDDKDYHPDFTCINPRTMEIIYWEHWGSMDSASYVNRQIDKLKKYRSVGIVLGKNLFVTMETYQNPLNSVTINQFIDDYLS